MQVMPKSILYIIKVYLRNITLENLEALISEMAKKYKDDCKCDEEAAKQEIKSKLAAAQKQLHGTVSIQI